MGAPLSSKGGISSAMALSSFIKGLIGAGSLSLSQQAMSGGILLYSVFLITLTYLALWCILRLVDCTEVIMLVEARRVMIMRKFKETIIRRRQRGHSLFSENNVSDDHSSQNNGLDTIDQSSHSEDFQNYSKKSTDGQNKDQIDHFDHSTTLPFPLIPLSDLPLPESHSITHNTSVNPDYGSNGKSIDGKNFGAKNNGTEMCSIQNKNISVDKNKNKNNITTEIDNEINTLSDSDLIKLTESHDIVLGSDDVPLPQLDEYLDLNVSLFDHYPQWCDDDITKSDRATIQLPSFNEIGQASLGPFGGVLVNFCIIITQLGSCTAYVIFISGAMGEISGLSHQTWTLLLAVPLILLAFLRNLKSLAPMASFGNFVYLYTLLILFYQGFSGPTTPVNELNLWDSSQAPIVFGSLSFALEGIVLCLPLKEKMNNPDNFRKTMILGMGIVLFVYFSLGNLGYLFYGTATKSPIISNLDPNAWSTDSVKIALSISLFFTFAMQLFPVSLFADSVIDTYWFGFDFNSLRLSQQRKDSGAHNSDNNNTHHHNHNQYNQQQLNQINYQYNQTYGQSSPNQVMTPHQQSQHKFQQNVYNGSNIQNQLSIDPFLIDTYQNGGNNDNNNNDDENDDSMLRQYDILLANTTPRHRSTSSSAISVPNMFIGTPSSSSISAKLTPVSEKNDKNGPFSQKNNTFSHNTSQNNDKTVLTDGQTSYHINNTSDLYGDTNASVNTMSYQGHNGINGPTRANDNNKNFSTTHSITPSYQPSTVALSYHSHQPQRTQDNLLIYTDEQLIPPQQRCLRLLLQNIHRISTVTLCITIALIFPQFSLIIALFGSFTNALLAYILPALFWTQICGHYTITRQHLITLSPTKASSTNSSTTSGSMPMKSPYTTSIRPITKPGALGTKENEHKSAVFAIPKALRNTIVWFPYDRLGRKTQPPPLGVVLKKDGIDIGNKDSAINRFTKANPSEKTKETDTLLPHHPNQSATSSSLWAHNEIGFGEKFSAMTFAYVVIIIGSISSFIGVTASVKDLLAQFRPGIA